MDIRTATAHDTEEIARLYAVSFPSVVKTIDEWCDDLQPNARRTFDDILVAAENGHVAGALTLYRHTVSVGGVQMKSGGIGGVAVLPEARMNGIAKTLMTEACTRMRATHVPLSLLYPFKQSFYQKLGYGLIGELKTMNVPSTVIPRFSERDNVHPLVDHELGMLSACYDAFARRSSFCIARSADAWKMEVKRAHKNRWTYWCHHADDGITGYMLIDEKEQLIVREFVYLTPSALRGLLGFLAVYKTHNPLLIPYAPDEHFHLLCTDPVDIGQRMLFGLYPVSGQFGHALMLRIVDVHEALKQRTFRRAEGVVTFHILDDQIPENSTTATLIFNGDAVEYSDELTTHLVSLTVSTFAQLYAGFMTFTSARYTGLIDAYFDVSFLDDAFALPAPHCLDFF
ncbi:MAG: enhanced intracellular survival protein Eis [Acidobacteriota bacterium]